MTSYRCPRCGSSRPGKHWAPCPETTGHAVYQVRVPASNGAWAIVARDLPLWQATACVRVLVSRGHGGAVFTRLGSRVLTSDAECVEAAQASRGRGRAA